MGATVVHWVAMIEDDTAGAIVTAVHAPALVPARDHLVRLLQDHVAASGGPDQAGGDPAFTEADMLAPATIRELTEHAAERVRAEVVGATWACADLVFSLYACFDPECARGTAEELPGPRAHGMESLW